MIKPKNKVCVSCGRDDMPWFSKERCKYCSAKSYGKPKAVSDKRKEEKKEYPVLRKEFLEKHPVCQSKLLGCTGVSTEIHHKNKRFGKRLNDTEHFLATCRSCHDTIENSMSAAEAIENGLRVKQKPNG